MASTGCEHNQVRILLVNLANARAYWIAARAHLGYRDPEPLKNLEGIASLSSTCHRARVFRTAGNLDRSFPFTAASVHDNSSWYLG